MNQIERLSRLDLAKVEEHNGKKGYYAITTDNGFMPMLDYNKLVDKLNELIETVNRLEEKVNEMAQS